MIFKSQKCSHQFLHMLRVWIWHLLALLTSLGPKIIGGRGTGPGGGSYRKVGEKVGGWVGWGWKGPKNPPFAHVWRRSKNGTYVTCTSSSGGAVVLLLSLHIISIKGTTTKVGVLRASHKIFNSEVRICWNDVSTFSSISSSQLTFCCVSKISWHDQRYKGQRVGRISAHYIALLIVSWFKNQWVLAWLLYVWFASTAIFFISQYNLRVSKIKSHYFISSYFK
jgi:hypothetical protein